MSDHPLLPDDDFRMWQDPEDGSYWLVYLQPDGRVRFLHPRAIGFTCDNRQFRASDLIGEPMEVAADSLHRLNPGERPADWLDNLGSPF